MNRNTAFHLYSLELFTKITYSFLLLPNAKGFCQQFVSWAFPRELLPECIPQYIIRHAVCVRTAPVAMLVGQEHGFESPRATNYSDPKAN
jgi:hypothetical protein